MSKRTLTALLAGLVVFAATFASAAGFGGLTSDAVGADSAAVAACDPNGVSVSYASPTWDAIDKRYEIGTVTTSGVADTCDGAKIKVSLLDSGDAQIGEGTLTIPSSPATSHDVALSPAPAAGSITRVHVVIGS